MGYTIALTNSASQNEGSGGSPATFNFTITRQAGDVGIANSYRIYKSDFAVADDFTFAEREIQWVGGELTHNFQVIANSDTTIEPNESFFLYIYAENPPGGAVILQSSTITLVNDDVGPPVFTTTSFNAAENGLAVGTVVTTGPSGTTYAKTGAGADEALFSITGAGVLTFTGNQDFENPGDFGANRVYEVQISATGGGQTVNQLISVTLTNVNEGLTIDNGDPYGGADTQIAENSTATIYTPTRTDIDGGADAVTWSISGGVDAAAFAINASTGALSFTTGRNFEAPTDSGANNLYDVVIKATDGGGLSDTQAVTVRVNNAAEDPVISSNGGGDLAFIRVNENTTTVTTIATVVATDQDAGAPVVQYSIDAASPDFLDFTINANTGVLTFAASPNYEAPADFNLDNLYQIDVIATTDGTPDRQTLYIMVDNVIEPGVPTDVAPAGGGSGGTGGSGGVNGTSGNDNLPGTEGPDVRSGGDGDDTITGGGGDDVLDGDNGNDLVTGGAGGDNIRGLAGDDMVQGGLDNDTVNGNTGNDTVFGDEGADSVLGGQDQDLVYGGDGDDFHVNGNMGNDTVYGGAGNDTVHGGKDNDSVYGEDGDDRIAGDLGNDHLFGGAGADRFYFQAGHGNDWVVDFNAGQGDRILLATGTVYTAQNHAGQVLITLSDGSAIGLVGVSFDSFSSTWITFGS